MDTIKLPAAFAALLALSTLAIAPLHAQVQRSGGGSANAALMQQYQQAVAERSQLQADNEKLKKDNEDLKKQLEAAKKELAGSKAGMSRNQSALAAAQASSDSNARALADNKAKMQELIGRFRETLTNLRQVETERAQLQQQLGQSKSAFDQCAQRNDALFQVDNEVLDRYEHQGAFSNLARIEPFTRIKRTQIENLALEYRQRAAELRVQKPSAPDHPAGAGGTVPAPAAASPNPAASESNTPR